MIFFMTEWDMKEDVEAIREHAFMVSEDAFKTNKQEIFLAWRAVLFLLKTALKRGLLELESSLIHMRTDKIPLYHYLTTIVFLVTNATEINLIFEVMTNDYYSRNNPKPGEVFILYLYIFFVQQMYCEDISWASTKNLDTMTLEQILELNLEIIPCEYREEFRRRITRSLLV